MRVVPVPIFLWLLTWDSVSIRSSGGWRQTPMDWNDDALAALKKDVPFFVRPAVRRRVESMAAEESRQSIDLSFYQQAKASMGPK